MAKDWDITKAYCCTLKIPVSSYFRTSLAEQLHHSFQFHTHGLVAIGQTLAFP